VDELKPHRVKALTRQAWNGLFCAVDRVAQDRVAEVGHVHANLMRAARFEPAPHMRVAGITGDDLPVRYRAASTRNDGHALAVAAVARDGRVDRAAVLT